MSNMKIDLEKLMSEPSDILKRLYEETPLEVMTQEDFNNIPLNKNYKKTEIKPKEEEVKEEIPHESKR